MIRPRRSRWSGGRTRLDTRSSTNAGKETCFTFSSGNAPDWTSPDPRCGGRKLMGVPAVREARRGHGLPVHGHSRARPQSIHRVLHNGPRDAGDVAYADPRNRRRDRGPQVASRLATARAELVPAPRTISRLPAGRRARPPRVRVPDVDRLLREHRGDLRGVMKAFDEGTDRLAYAAGPECAWNALMSRRESSKRPAPGAPEPRPGVPRG